MAADGEAQVEVVLRSAVPLDPPDQRELVGCGLTAEAAGDRHGQRAAIGAARRRLPLDRAGRRGLGHLEREHCGEERGRHRRTDPS
ncbi:hypothetical protein OV079_06815 [Nannocystis pusilla]|uniref:Uncharacterized protein n=1 Tax=Nannocystis pusilla TaxID=889268 RepID=A0A9X3EJK6_9BACT|nr:hypothetical protein [Nannocystis pusilla]MCY1005288.1 hypothetical protein [Nannocystis pusilla]